MLFFFSSQALQNELDSKEPDMNLLLDKGQKIVDSASTSPMSDVSDLSEKLESLREGWKELHRVASERDLRLKEADKLADQFHSDADLLAAWLNLAEEKLNNVPTVGKQNCCAIETKHHFISAKIIYILRVRSHLPFAFALKQVALQVAWQVT